MLPLSRRQFLQDSARLAAAIGAAGSLAAPHTVAAAKKGDVNDQLRVACIGVRGRGQSHVQGLAGQHNCVVTTICDADEAVIGPAMRSAEKVQGHAPKFEQDLRRVFDDKSIDLVCIATPNHWHALAAIWAMQAGKDVYVEKPVSHNVSEGRRMVETARRLNKICQTGTQIRSTDGMRAAIEFLRSGKLGKIFLARGLCYKNRPSIGKVKGPQEPPKTVDYDLWCGPAPKNPVMRRQFHYDWHWQWDFGNGDLGNQGIHQMDVARWGLGKNELAKSVLSVGGRFGYEDDGQTANTQISVFDYGDAKLIFEVRGLKTDPLLGAGVGNIFHGTEGILVCPGYSTAIASFPDGTFQRFDGGGDHFGNFVKAVRARKYDLLNADILEGHLSSALCHLANISYRLGTPQTFSKSDQVFAGNKQVHDALARAELHLSDNKVPLDKTPLRVGRTLMIDPKTETFINDAEANTYLTRQYRKGFEVPEKV